MKKAFVVLIIIGITLLSVGVGGYVITQDHEFNGYNDDSYAPGSMMTGGFEYDTDVYIGRSGMISGRGMMGGSYDDDYFDNSNILENNELTSEEAYNEGVEYHCRP